MRDVQKGADYPARDRRFDVVYHMLSMSHNTRIRVKVTTDTDVPVPSITELFPNADWCRKNIVALISCRHGKALNMSFLVTRKWRRLSHGYN